MNASDSNFNIIRHRGAPNKATLPDGRTVSRSTILMLADPKTGIPVPFEVTQYNDHFIFKMPNDVLGSGIMCTCGSVAVIDLESNKVVCYFYEASRRSAVGVAMHANLQQRWV